MKKAKIEGGQVFERHEKKHLIGREQTDALLALLPDYMERDRYDDYTISSLYYDTEDYALIRHSLDRPAFKEKLRVRSYGTPGERDKVYLELKKKLDGVTYKRRISLPLGDCRDYLDYGITPETDDPSFGEIDWFTRRHRLAAKVVISYDRIAFSGIDDPGLRLTFDRNIRWRDHSLDLSKGDFGTALLPPGQCLLEVKTEGAVPMWLCGILSGLRVYQRSFSKYGVIYSQYLMGGKEGFRHVG